MEFKDGGDGKEGMESVVSALLDLVRRGFICEGPCQCIYSEVT